MHAMVGVWAVFTFMLFVAEPLFLHRWFQETAKSAPERTFRRIEVLHWFLLTISLVTVAGAVAGSHGWTW
jgi:peptidoglycan biosynthesis protein MviN/MurJ (putative lipid II flippase)